MEYEGIQIGDVNAGDVEFLRSCAVSWPELKKLAKRNPWKWPGISEVAGLGSPYPDQANQQPEDE